MVDALGHLTLTSYYPDGMTMATVDSLSGITTHVYDYANRNTLVTNSLGDDTAMAYNADGTLASLTKPGPRTTSYQYDNARRRRSAPH